MNTTQDNLAIATTIAKQIGARAFFMLGTRQKLATENGLLFDLRGSPLHIHKIQVRLDPSDTYTVQFWTGAMGRHPAKLIHEADNIYADGLCQCIEINTGLRTQL